MAKVENSQSYISFTWWLQLLMTLLVLTVMEAILSLDYFADFHQIRFSVFLFSMGVLLHDYCRKVLLALDRVAKVLMVDVMVAFLQFSVLVFLVVHDGIYLDSVMCLLGISFLCSIVYALWVLRPRMVSAKDVKAYYLLHKSQGLWLFLVAILQWCASNFFILVSGVYLGLEALGAFRLVQSLFGILNMLLQTFENYVLPSLSRIYNNSASDAKSYLRKVSLEGGLLFFTVLAVLFMFSKDIIVLAGGIKYAEYDYVVKLMAILYVIIYIGYPVRLSIRVLMLNQYFFVGYVISFVFSLLSFHYLLKMGNLFGAVMGLGINQLLMMAYWQYQLIQHKFYLWK